MFKKIPEYETFFIDEGGRVVSRISGVEHDVVVDTDAHGCAVVRLFDGEKQVVRRVANLVLEVFVGKPFDLNKKFVRYKDGDVKNVSLSNLEWCRRNKASEESKGTPRNVGESNPKARLTPAEVQEIRRLARTGNSQMKIAALFGISQKHVSEIVSHKMWPDVPD